MENKNWTKDKIEPQHIHANTYSFVTLHFCDAMFWNNNNNYK